MTIKLDTPENYPAYNFFTDTSGTFNVVWTDDMTVSEKSAIYWHAGCHPDLVEYVWDTLGANLPINCCCTINDRPVLLHKKSNILLAVCIGTSFILRVIQDDLNVAITEKYKTFKDWNGPKDLEKEFGLGWFYGAFSQSSEIFCLNSFDAYNYE